MVTLTVGKNSYGTLAEADTYLDQSARAWSAWLGVAPDDKRRALITAYRALERRAWQGTSAAVQIVDLASVDTGGTGYALKDVLTVSDGTFGESAEVKITAVASGVVTAVELLHAGTYSAVPTTPAATTGGAGSGCTIALTFTDQIADFPRVGLTDCDGDTVDGTTYPTQMTDAQFELAFDISQDTSEETSSGQGTNVKSVQAGSASVEFFTPKADTQRFPQIVHELISCFLASSSTVLFGGARSGAGNESYFDGYPGNNELTGGV